MHSSALHAVRSEETATADVSGPQNVESLGRRLRDALPPLRLHSVSIYDNECNVLWLSEGALGPDEHALVLDAVERLGTQTGEAFEQRVEDGRVAVFLPVRAPQAAVHGLVMVLADTKAPGEGLLARICTAPVQGLVRALTEVIRPAPPRRLEHDPTGLLLSLAADVPPESAGGPPRHTPARDLSPTAVEEILTRGTQSLSLELAPPAPEPVVASASAPARAAAIPEPPAAAPVSMGVDASTSTLGAAAERVMLDVLPFVKLRSGGRMRRFEVLPRGAPRLNRDPAVLDTLAAEALLGWMVAHRSDWTLEPTCFTLNLSIATLEDDRFLRTLGAHFSRSAISPDSIGFEIAEPLCTQRRAQVERFMAGCEKLGSFVVIDDFSFDSAVVPLLRSKALRLVKIDARLTGGALRDKLSQALVVAVAQAVKVLGMHCAAQQVDSQAALQWLTAVGCDFAQGPMLARQQPLETLLRSDS